MTGSMLIQGKRNKIVLLIKEDDKIEANLPSEYRTNDFYGDLTFALVTARTSRSPIKSEIEFLERFIELYDAQVEEGTAPVGKEFIPPDSSDKTSDLADKITKMREKLNNKEEPNVPNP